MNIEELGGLAIAGVVMLIGLIGTCVPGIPGAPLILAAAIGHKMYFGEQSASYFALVLLLLLTIMSLVLDFLGTMLGAKKLGATWRGMVGASLGAIIGIFFSLPGLILGPIIGAFLFELAGGRAWKESAQAGAGAMLGLLFGALGKVICCVIMIAIFFFSSTYRYFHSDRHPNAVLAAFVHPRSPPECPGGPLQPMQANAPGVNAGRFA